MQITTMPRALRDASDGFPNIRRAMRGEKIKKHSGLDLFVIKMCKFMIAFARMAPLLFVSFIQLFQPRFVRWVFPQPGKPRLIAPHRI